MRLLGFPEREEGLVERWIRDVLQPDGLSKVFVVEHAQRALVAPPMPVAPPRAIIARLLNYKDRDCIVWTNRETDRAVLKNCKISIYPDYTNKAQTSRKGFLEVKAKLRAMNIRCMLLYPAHLKLISGGKSYFFFTILRRSGDGCSYGTRLDRSDLGSLELAQLVLLVWMERTGGCVGRAKSRSLHSGVTTLSAEWYYGGDGS
ncbi:hypothetical protein NDU88_005589 [Pleurodeles waltl]|uniref:Uncharacterized protein n=1 Tax=Pleurodeles waltl TaxID=8319 RepID=A0AAV7NPF5_PLEWA|nr:hypothetical protein NDU88_005589 [Pleurodeles waltl]